MLEVCRMPSYPASDSLRCESYNPTPRTQPEASGDSSKELTEPEQATEKVVGDERVVRNREGVRSAPPSHFSEHFSENLIKNLVENSEQCSLDDALVFESAIYDDWSEAASGWHQVVPYPKYITRQPQQAKSESIFKKGSGKRVSVRCVDDDFGNDPLCPSWKANVEPVTYRYIPNNGCYRSSKSNTRDMREFIASKKGRSERSLVTPEVRQAQKTLKRDLDNHFKGGNDPSSGTNPSSQRLSEEQCEAADSGQDDKIPSENNQVFSVQNPGYIFAGKRRPAREQKLIKSASDLFMENFNTRLSALEKEIQPNYPPATPKKPHENQAALNVSKKIKDCKVPDTPKSTGQGMQEAIGEDLFTVIPMCRPDVPLRPLEKVTPKHKMMEYTPTASTDRTPSQSPLQENDTNIILASATTQPQLAHRDSMSNKSIDTARSAIAMTNFDIEKMRMHPSIERSVPFRSDYRTRAASFLVQQGHAAAPPTARKGAMRYTAVPQPQQQSHDQLSSNTIEEESVGGDFRSVGKTRAKDMEAIGGGLPEIMGKRLTVTTTTHRLL